MALFVFWASQYALSLPLIEYRAVLYLIANLADSSANVISEFRRCETAAAAPLSTAAPTLLMLAHQRSAE